MTKQTKQERELVKTLPEYKTVEEAQKAVFQTTDRFQAFMQMNRGNMAVKISLK